MGDFPEGWNRSKRARKAEMRNHRKATDLAVTREFLAFRLKRAEEAGYGKAKWIEFCEAMLDRGFTLTLYEARKTFSKYITVEGYGKLFKVRFSNHKPIKHREYAKDCDFFVGINHTHTTTTAQAVAATIQALESVEDTHEEG